mgnify:CR=1 FL=1
MPISRSLWIPLAGIWTLLIAATTLVAILSRFGAKKDFANLIERTKSWWVLLAIFTGAVLGGKTATIILFAGISFIALREFFRMTPMRKSDSRVLLWGYASVLFQFYWTAIGWYGMFIVFIPVYGLLLLSFRLILTQETEDFLRAAGSIYWGLMICVYSISHLAYFFSLPPLHGSALAGPKLLIFLVFLSQFNDVSQYACGKLIGKQKVLPLISPNKTWEGLIGGICITTAASLCLSHFLTPFNWVQSLFAGILIALTGFLGDVTISAVKRDMRIKDTGSLIPGHGGVLDRIDSLTFSSPLFFHLIYYLYY